MEDMTKFRPMAYVLMFGSLLGLSVCRSLNQSTTQDMSGVIARFANDSFGGFANISVQSRGRLHDDFVYMVNEDRISSPTYTVYYNPKKQKVVKIDDSRVVESIGTNYFHNSKIDSIIRMVYGKGLSSLVIDSTGNAFITPVNSTLPLQYLRLKKNNADSILHCRYSYRKIRMRWYYRVMDKLHFYA